MKFEYEVYGSVEDLLMVAANSFSLSMKQISTMFVYDGYVITYSPTLGGEKDESLWIVSLAKGSLPLGLIEFDPETKQTAKILKPTNPEKSHFLVVKPEKSTILEKAMESFGRK
jgi:hypothetical protein